MNYQAQAIELLEHIANSVHDRQATNDKPFFFNLNEVKVTEEWLINFAKGLENL